MFHWAPAMYRCYATFCEDSSKQNRQNIYPNGEFILVDYWRSNSGEETDHKQIREYIKYQMIILEGSEC